jgi:MbtH protein
VLPTACAFEASNSARSHALHMREVPNHSAVLLPVKYISAFHGQLVLGIRPSVPLPTLVEDAMESGVRRYLPVVNDEEQYSIWAVDRELPPGWSAAGPEGTREECLAFIEEVWTDMRPRSLRERMARTEGASNTSAAS